MYGTPWIELNILYTVYLDISLCLHMYLFNMEMYFLQIPHAKYGLV